VTYSQLELKGYFGVEKFINKTGSPIPLTFGTGKVLDLVEYLPVENGHLIRRQNFVVQRFDDLMNLLWETKVDRYAKDIKNPSFFLSADAKYAFLLQVAMIK
jgi:hypothetical protein